MTFIIFNYFHHQFLLLFQFLFLFLFLFSFLLLSHMSVQLDPLRTDGDAGNEVRFKLQDTHDEYGPMAKDLRVRTVLYSFFQDLLNYYLKFCVLSRSLFQFITPLKCIKFDFCYLLHILFYFMTVSIIFYHNTTQYNTKQHNIIHQYITQYRYYSLPHTLYLHNTISHNTI